MKEQIAIEDLRAYIKFGLRRGYTLRQMANALNGSNINTNKFKNVAKEEALKEMDYRATYHEQKTEIYDKYLERLKKVMKNLKGKD